MMEIRWAVKEDLPQINQLITDHPESFVKAKTAADLNDKNKLLLVAVTKEKRIIGFAQADVQQSEERLDQRPSGKLIQHTLVTKENTEEIQKFAEYLMLEAKKKNKINFCPVLIKNSNRRRNTMSCLGNVIWFIFGGLIGGLSWLAAGILWCITIIGIPIGMQCFKIASLSFAPFGKEVIYHQSGMSLIVNIIWLIVSGLPIALAHVVSGILLCITIIGIPFAKQSFKLARLALMPFGAEIV